MIITYLLPVCKSSICDFLEKILMKTYKILPKLMFWNVCQIKKQFFRRRSRQLMRLFTICKTGRPICCGNRRQKTAEAGADISAHRVSVFCTGPRYYLSPWTMFSAYILSSCSVCIFPLRCFIISCTYEGSDSKKAPALWLLPSKSSRFLYFLLCMITSVSSFVIAAAAVRRDVFLHIFKRMYIQLFYFLLKRFWKAVKVFVTGDTLVQQVG